MTPKRATSRHIITKMSKVKERILKATTEKELPTEKGAPIRLPGDFSTETWQVRKDWCKIFKVMKSKKL